MNPRLSLLAATALAAAAPSLAMAQQAGGYSINNAPPSIAVGGNPVAAASEPSFGEPGFTTQLFSASRSNLLGDMYGLRTFLINKGITLNLQETSELFGNATGGVHQGAAYDGLTQMSMALDTLAAFGIQGGTLQVSAFQIHGRNLSADDLYTLQTASGIEAQRATRLWEAWYEQDFYEDRLSFKVGQQSLDNEFYTSDGSALFLNTMMGWPLVPSVDLYAGGPAYPLSSLGVRIRGEPVRDFAIQLGVFDDNPSGGPFDNDSQVRGAEQSGTAFHTGTGALVIGEMQFEVNTPELGELASPDEKPGLPGNYKLGFWYDTARFADQRFGTDGLSLANPASNGDPVMRRGNFSFYGTFDQAVWHPDPNGFQILSVFARAMGAPGDRNLVNFSINGGATLTAPLPGRKYDKAGIGFGVGHVSPSASQLDQDTNAYGTYTPVRSSETFVELTYQYQVAPWFTVQPDFQYVWMPSGGIANPLQPSTRIGNEAVFGVRSVIVF